MKHDITTNERMSKIVYSLSTYDIEWAGDNGSWKELLKYLKLQAMGRAQSVCTDQTGSSDAKTYDRGIVSGMFEVIKFLDRAQEEGRRLTFPEERIKPPKIV